MNTRNLLLSLFALASAASNAAPVVLEDFESYAVGTKLSMWSYWGATPASTATVEKDPSNANNKVLHIRLSEWGCFVPFTLPAKLAGSKLTTKEFISLRLYRSADDQNDYKKFMIYHDKELLYEDDGYPQQGNKSAWQQRTYALPATTAATGTQLALGFNSDGSDYYIDDVAVKSQYDDYEIIEGTVTKDISAQNTSKTYATLATPFLMKEGSNLIIKSARYSNLTSTIVGEGRIDLYSGGERTYLGSQSTKVGPDWTSFKGDLHVWPYKDLSSSNGFYGLICINNHTFNVDAVMTDIEEANAYTALQNSSLTLHEGTTMAFESGVRGIRIGRLSAEAGSQIYGYMKNDGNSAKSQTFYIVGHTGEDAVLAGRISTMGDNTANTLGLIKEGLGTYRITGNRNMLTGGIRILRGRVLINNDAAQAKSQKLTGATGTPASATTTGVYVMKDGIVGGTGHIAAVTNLYGILQPGDDGIGTLSIADYAKGYPLSLILRPTARIDCEIASATSYDQVQVEGPVSYYNIGQDFAVSTQMPRLRIQLASEADLHEGDEFTLLTATGKQSYQDVDWEFKVIYPKAYTWKVEQQQTAEGFRVVARVTSVIYTGQGEAADDDDTPETSTDDGTFDVEAEMADHTPLRGFLDGKECYIGTCVPVWSLDIDNDKEARSALIAQEYNMVVCENEMKFDATEPSRNSFNFEPGTKLVNFAARHHMRVRGHALAWHSQVPDWLTTDGTKNSRNFSRDELLAILKNHIQKVVGQWKGKIAEWDVANEVLSDNQSSIYSDPNAYDLRPSVWATGIGEDFLDSAFVWAHQCDPEALLILNDYGVEGKGWGKSEALFNLAMRLKNSGIPIDGVGLQAHMDAGLGYVRDIEANIKRYQEAGLLCHITELDLGIDGTTDANLAAQAKSYYQMARIAMRNPNCKSLMIWGLSDDLTWRTGKNPLLFGSKLNAKPAYWGAHAALRQSVGAELPTDLELLPIDTRSFDLIYDLQGRSVSRIIPGQLYIINGRRRFIQK